MNPRISPRKPEGTRSNRVIPFNNVLVKKHFDNLDLLMEKFKVIESTVFKMKHKCLLFRNILKYCGEKTKKRLVQLFVENEGMK